MFGYIRPYEGELKGWQIRAYKACYCGVCRSLGKCSPLCRLMLRYDLAFLALVRATQSGVSFTASRCPLHPFRKQEMLSGGDTEYAATLHVLLSHAKWRDDLRDGAFLSVFPYLLYGWAARRARKKLPAEAEAIRTMLEEQRKLEKENCTDADQSAEPFAKLMASLFSHDTQGETREELSYLGYTVGKFISWADALDDWEKDKKHGRYNVFVLLYPDAATARKEASPLLYACAQGAQAAFALLDESTLSPISENILTDGMLSVIESLGQKKRRGFPPLPADPGKTA